ncbi:hypothetical protein [Ktedonobacter racemifer]|uniref:Uncharacterized protein n=1 Tax=Ktedonobacter racemifer DSM 44963 TaxID=485913 RepID=D6U265_KTERA|nr:hypothetical protein [Ktedonobacter racemifer]EFH82733.1 hypothetical protein Krac_3576 [Ktedonobacter racemifer DSM 44963]
MEEKKPTSCALRRHQKFVRDATCLVCNPSLHPQSLRQILLDPAIARWYQSLVAGTYCHWLRCEKPGVHFDQLPDGHWWCDEHRYHGLFLQEGAARDFPAWEYSVGHTILVGRPNWYKSTTHATVEDVQCRVAKLRGISVELLPRLCSPSTLQLEQLIQADRHMGLLRANPRLALSIPRWIVRAINQTRLICPDNGRDAHPRLHVRMHQN